VIDASAITANPEESLKSQRVQENSAEGAQKAKAFRTFRLHLEQGAVWDLPITGFFAIFPHLHGLRGSMLFSE